MTALRIEGYEDAYEITSTGIVRSLARKVKGKDGAIYPFAARELLLLPNKQNGYYQVSLWKNNKGKWFYLHRLLATHFIPNPDNLPEVNHIDGIKTNNNLNNLEWVTRLGNITHAIKTGLRVYENRLSKEEFIECLSDVIDGESYLSLSKRTPYKVPFLSTKIRKISKELKLEHLLDESLYHQKIRRARINGTKNCRQD